MKGSDKITYQFQGTFTNQEFQNVQYEIELCGGTLIYKGLHTDKAFIVVKVEDDEARLAFERKFKRTRSYERSKQYEEEQKEFVFFSAVNEGFMHWTEERLQLLFGKQGSNLDETWGLMAILLNEGLIQVRAEEYSHVAEPPEGTKEREAFYHCYNNMTNLPMGYISWCGWNWLRSKGEVKPIFTDSRASLYSPVLHMFVQVEEGNPFQIIYKILAERSNVYVHMPSHPLHKLYIFETTEMFHYWLEQHRYGSQVEEPSDIQQLLSTFIYYLRGTEEYRQRLKDYDKKRAAQASKETPPGKLLDEYDDDTLFDLIDASSIIHRLNGAEMTADLLEILIMQREIKAQRLKDLWVISKQSLLDYLYTAQIHPENDLNSIQEPKPKETVKIPIPTKEDRDQIYTNTEDEDFNLFDVGLFIKNDPTYGIGVSPRIGQLKKLIQSGELKAHHEKNIWTVRKNNLIQYLQKQKNESDSYPTTDKRMSKEEKAPEPLPNKKLFPVEWTDEKDQQLIRYVLDSLKKGKKFDEIFATGIKETGMNSTQCKCRWYSKWSNQYKDEIAQIKAKINPTTENNPFVWDEEKENILFSSIIEGTREGRTIKEITEEVSKIIGLPPNTLRSYWGSKAPKHLKEEFKQIKLDQEKNWSEEALQMLEHMITVEFAHLTPFDILPIASKRLKRHIDIVRKKLFELQRAKRVRR
ncbi:hypothetical protein [Neobacillus sp. B4I6]|uniref:hypothetical protein n=1 Tax=Neobacillus sp. B4I6 TaxID=3373925 RepID=UPI003D262687